jgi:LCP family protein required for cell wall assembly
MPNPFKKKSNQLDLSSVIRSARKKEHHLFRHGWVKLLAAAMVLVGAAAGYGIWFFFDLQGDVQRRIPSIEDVPGRDDNQGNFVEGPHNVLLVGSDSRAGLTKKEQRELGANPVEGQRADTLILAHVDPESGRITMVQFPRDLYVPILDEGEARINSALEDGHDHLVRTVANLTGLSIHHYVQVNIAGFKEVVDALGGVDICITDPIPFDEQTGIEITAEELGMVHFDGALALRFVRTRKTLEEGDLDRIANQQRFLAAALDKALSTGTLVNIGKLNRLKKAAGRNVVIDDKTDLFDLRDLARQFRSFDADTYEAYTVPNRGPGMVGDASVVLPDAPAMKVMFDALGENRSPQEAAGGLDFDPSTVRVGVYNGTGREGAATKASRELVDATRLGTSTIKLVDVANADSSNLRRTFIRYSGGAKNKAEFISKAIPGARVVKKKTPKKVDVEVLVGRVFDTRRLIQIQPIPLPEKSEPPAGCR